MFSSSTEPRRSDGKRQVVGDGARSEDQCVGLQSDCGNASPRYLLLFATVGQGEGSKESGNDVKLIIWGCYSRLQVRVYSWVDVGLRAVEDLFDIA